MKSVKKQLQRIQTISDVEGGYSGLAIFDYTFLFYKNNRNILEAIQEVEEKNSLLCFNHY